MKGINKILLCFLLFYTVCYIHAEEYEVIGSGTAKGEPGHAGELALARALRDAVQKGAGVDLLSETKVQNFKLGFDRIITSSFGYIKSYQVIEQKYSKQGEYTVKIKAKVGKKTPGMSNVLALRMLVKRMESPRVLVDCKEDILGIKRSSALTNDVIEKIAKKTGFETFDPVTVSNVRKTDAARAGILGDKKDEAAKKAGITSAYDMVIKGVVTGDVSPIQEPFPGMKTRDLAFGYNLKAVWYDTGETIATINLADASYQAKGLDPVTLPRQLVRKYLARVLEGQQDETLKKANVYKLFQRIIAKWIVELDLGAKIRLEFKKIDKKSLDKVIDLLRRTQGVSYAWRREFDRDFDSVVEVESRLKTRDLEDVILKNLNGKYAVEQASKRRLRFIPAK